MLPPLIGTARADDAPSPADLADAGPNGDVMIGSSSVPTKRR